LANPNLSQIKRVHKFLQTSPNLSTHIRWKRNQWLDLPYNNLSETMACLTLDGAGEQTGPKTEFMQNVRKHGIEHHVSKPHRPQQNRAESIIREVKKWWFQQMTKLWVPTRLWDYGIVWVCKIMSLSANSVFSLAGRAPIEQITGQTPDISEYLH
jgi:hypothetical protein